MGKSKRIKPISPYDPLEEHRGDEPKDMLKIKTASAKSKGIPKIKTANKDSRLYSIIIYLTVAATFSVIAFVAVIISHMDAIINSRKEYEYLREAAETEEIKEIEDATKPEARYLSAFDMEMRQINSEYLCWLKIEDTLIDYPVVRGNDNEKYLGFSFSGEENIYGSIFMDYRCKGEYVPHIIIYGHNTKTGDMFGGLRKFLDSQYLKEHPVITLKIDDRLVEYEIFSARKTDVSDPAYQLDFSSPGSFDLFADTCGAPSGVKQIVTLSTCVSGDDKDERVIVQGTLK